MIDLPEVLLIRDIRLIAWRVLGNLLGLHLQAILLILDDRLTVGDSFVLMRFLCCFENMLRVFR